MGCAQSRVDNEEAVARCKERRNLMKEAVVARNAFAAGHSAYAMALKNTGAALSDYGHGESDQTLDPVDHHHFQQQHHHQQPVDPAPQPPPPPPLDNLPPPPPPLPKFSPSPIKRAISLPAMAFKGRRLRGVDSVVIEEAGEDKDGGEEREKEKGKEEDQTPPRTPENVGNAGKRPETPEMVSASPANNMAWDYFFMVENMPGPSLDDGEIANEYGSQNNDLQMDEGENEERPGGFKKNFCNNVAEEIEPKTPEKVEEEEEEEDEEEEQMVAVVKKKKKKKGKATIEHSNTAPPDLRRVAAKTAVANVSLMKILDEVDDRFLKAFECAQEVSKMLEATRLHYHSNFADNRGTNVITLCLFDFRRRVSCD